MLIWSCYCFVSLLWFCFSFIVSFFIVFFPFHCFVSLLLFCFFFIVFFLFHSFLSLLLFFLYAGCVHRIVVPACCDGFSALRIFPCKPWPVALFSLLLFCFSYKVFLLFFYRLNVFRSLHISVGALLSLVPAANFSLTVRV